MPLSTGARLGPYEVLSAIGAGGMGEVYKARDTRLDRIVAIKVLPAGFAADPDRRRRFEHEARAVAALDHPHICALYDVGSQDTVEFLVMAYLDGETLAARLRRGPLPLAQALELGAQIADALAAAHRHHIVHRDLKPGNIMLVKVGAGLHAKLLDFGLAKLREPAEPAVALSSIATQEPMTARGAVLGTVPYMAPEQLEGKEADARTDIFALGCVLYEMLTGRRAFLGRTEASLIAAILTSDPPSVNTQQPVTPPALDRLVRRCLAKDPDERWSSAHDIAEELRGIAADLVTLATARGAGRWPSGWLWAGAVVALLAAAAVGALLGGVVMRQLQAPQTTQPVARLTMEVRPVEDISSGNHEGLSWPTAGGSRTALTWTPDGRALVFVGRRGGVQQLYVRRLDAAEARPLEGTGGAQVPSVSPDGQWVAFFANGEIRKVRLAGGPTFPVSTTPQGESPTGLAWDPFGVLYFGAREPATIWRVRPGEAPTQVTTRREAEAWHGLPAVLPGGNVLLYTVRTHRFTSGDEMIVAQTLATGGRRVLLRDVSDARYVPTGHLLVMRQGELLAVPFDLATLTVRGDPVPLIDHVAQAAWSGGMESEAGQFAVSPTGALAWLSGAIPDPPATALVSVDRAGHVTPLAARVTHYDSHVRLSRDGRQLLVNIINLRGEGIWTYDLARGTLTPLVQDGEARWPIWSPDGQALTFFWNNAGRSSLARWHIGHAGPPDALAAGDLYPSSWTPDGRQLMVYANEDNSLQVATVDGPRATVLPYAQASKPAGYAEFSPDAHWIAYTEMGPQGQVYVERYPGPSVRVSLFSGGDATPISPAWRQDGRALFFIAFDPGYTNPRMMEVDFQPGLDPPVGKPRLLFRIDPTLDWAGGGLRAFDVTRDGQRFFFVQAGAPPPPTRVSQINVALNWFEELKAKVPVKR